MTSAGSTASLRVALGQFGASPDKAANLGRLEVLCERAATETADLVVFPEAAMYSGRPDESLILIAERLSGPFVTRLREAAARHGVAVVVGIFELTGYDSARVFNTVVAIDQRGELLGAYRKIHMYDAFGFRESDRIEAGNGETLLFTLAGWRIGVMTCYEVRFPEMARVLAEQGAELLLLPAAWVRGPLKEMHWVTLARARAIENTCYVAAAGQVSDTYAGLSTVFDPVGVAIASAADAETVVTTALDRDRLTEVRRRNPSLSLRRPEVYARWSAEATRA